SSNFFTADTKGRTGVTTDALPNNELGADTETSPRALFHALCFLLFPPYIFDPDISGFCGSHSGARRLILLPALTPRGQEVIVAASLCGLMDLQVSKEPNNKYIPVTVLMTWSSVQRYCREKYTDLTSMRTQQEKEDILKVTDESSWWIGVYRKL
ncbi:hypothetical protein KUCAC02_011133, partial [Chaenocephalus aceratus]